MTLNGVTLEPEWVVNSSTFLLRLVHQLRRLCEAAVQKAQGALPQTNRKRTGVI